ncbi:MAG: hypothetical protein RIT45_3981 [Pseudomonadota bacterium]
MNDARPEPFALHPLLATFRDPAEERAFRDHFFETVHALQARPNVLSAALAYLALAGIDVLVVPEAYRAFALATRLGTAALFLGLWAVASGPRLRPLRPVLPIAVAWAGTLHNLAVGAVIGGTTGVVYRYFVVLLMTLPALIGRCTVREATLCAGGSFLLLQAVELVHTSADPVVWIFLSATCLVGGAYGIYGARTDQQTAHHDFWQERVIAWQLRELAAERDRSRQLLRNVLPDSIATRLEAGERVIADSHASVTVLFADISGFTDYAGRVGPEGLVARLDEIFRRFDARCAAHGLEKIKTIGDAYMVAGGLPDPLPDHALRMARFARDLLAEIDAVNAERGETFAVRVGIHTGPVVAGVIGQRKFAYDLWGDAVNVASRMESHGEPGRVQLSASTAALVREAFELEPRGEVAIKGKGPMQTWFLGPEHEAGAPPC